MRLLHWQQPGELGFAHHTENIPPYAILSHTWGAEADEVIFEDLFTELAKEKTGFEKIRFCGKQAEADGLHHFWVDTCCINKANHAELSEAIASMFKWYQSATKCYVYLADVSAQDWESEIRKCRWFTRGWTLQELLAPKSVQFFAKEGRYLGDRNSLETVIHEITGIPLRALQGRPLAEFSVDERLSWARERRTTRPEDQAYCLQGIFNVFIPLIYGEGTHAWIRLSKAIAERLSYQDNELFGLLPNAMAKAVDEDENMIQQSLAFSEMHERRLKLEPRHQNTCKWISNVSEYQKWNSSKHGLLWIKGKPGAGKSTVMAYLYENFARQTTVPIIKLDFFLTARGTELQRTTLGLLRALMSQLFFHDPASRENIRARYREKSDSYGKQHGAWTWQQSELENMFADNVVALARNQPVTVFVDALDEAGEDSARRTAAYFHKLNDRTTSVGAQLKICISCRHYPIVTSRTHALEIVVEAHNKRDIASFIHDTLYLDGVIEEDPSNETSWLALKDELAQHANGVFQWAQLVVPLVQKYVDDGESLEAVRLRLQRVPAELRDLYASILRSLISRDDRQLAFHFFSWLCLAIRPLTVMEMRYALAAKGKDSIGTESFSKRAIHWIDSNERMKRRAKSLSGGLVEIFPRPRDKEDIIQVGHQSINDFMLAEGLALLLSLSGYQPTPSSMSNEELLRWSQATLYWSCLDFLATDAVIGDHTTSDIDVHVLLIDHPFLEYTTRHMFIHAQKAGAQRSNNLSDEVSVLLRILPAWVKFYIFLLHAQFGYNPNYHHWRTDAPNWKTTALHVVSQASLTDLLQHLLQNTRDVNCRDEWGRTPLHIAAHQGHIEIVERLYNAGADLNALDDYGQTPLVCATSRSHLSLVRWLLEHDAEVNPASHFQESALRTAARKGHVELVKILLSAGAEKDTGGQDLESPLFVAIREGHDRVVEVLLNAGADLDRTERSGSALCVAARSAQTRLVEKLLRAGANMYGAGFDGTPLCIASMEGHKDVVDLLIRYGVDVNHAEEVGMFPSALYAAALSGQEAVMASLIRAGANVNVMADDGRSVLGAAMERGDWSIIQQLLFAGARATDDTWSDSETSQ